MNIQPPDEQTSNRQVLSSTSGATVDDGDVAMGNATTHHQQQQRLIRITKGLEKGGTGVASDMCIAWGKAKQVMTWLLQSFPSKLITIMGNANHFLLLMNDGTVIGTPSSSSAATAAATVTTASPTASATTTNSSSFSPFLFVVENESAFTHSLSTLVFPEVLSELVLSVQVQSQTAVAIKAEHQLLALHCQNQLLMEHNRLLWSTITKQTQNGK